MSSLKEQFEQAVAAAMPQIEKHLKKATDALNKAKQVSRDYGVPFHSYIVDNSYDSYVPTTFRTQFQGLQEELDKEDEDAYSEFVESLTEVSAYDMYRGGWQKSYC